jgi:hypothetical protein
VALDIIKKYKQHTKDVISTIVENRGGHPEPLDQVQHILFFSFVFREMQNDPNNLY